MRLFIRIFLGFWLATILMIAVVLGVSANLPIILPGDHDEGFDTEAARTAITGAVDAYERAGDAAFLAAGRALSTARHDSFYLFDDQGQLLVAGGPAPPFYARIADHVLLSRHPEFSRFGFRVLFSCPVQSTSGRRYAVVMTVFALTSRPLNPRFWFNLGMAMLPSALVCMLLTLYLTRPITKLRATAQRLTEGDLTARAGPLILTHRDELGDLAREFDTMAAQIQLLMTAQRRFVADVSHELGAPLTRMHLALALHRRHCAGTDGGTLAKIERETDKLSNLVQQLLLLAGLEAGRIPAETLAPISIRSMCETIIEDANFEAAHAGCRITGMRQDFTLLAYPNLLRRAIDNVLRNGLRYTPAGAELRLDCRVNLIQREVRLEILDCGPGVPEPMLKEIFRPFFRAESGREATTGGTGLGLAIASEAVRLHDGSITAQNRKSGGLHVIITLPLRTPQSVDLAEPCEEVVAQEQA